MNGLKEKEYQIVRSNNLDKEKAKLTTEFEFEFNRVKVSCIKQFLFYLYKIFYQALFNFQFFFFR